HGDLPCCRRPRQVIAKQRHLQHCRAGARRSPACPLATARCPAPQCRAVAYDRCRARLQQAVPRRRPWLSPPEILRSICPRSAENARVRWRPSGSRLRLASGSGEGRVSPFLQATTSKEATCERLQGGGLSQIREGNAAMTDNIVSTISRFLTPELI